MATLPSFDVWSERAGWMIALGLLAYGGIIAVVLATKPSPSSPELRKLHAVRQAMASRLRERQVSERGLRRSELTEVLSEAIANLDDQVAPALRQLVDRQTALSRHLARYGSFQLPHPEPAVLQRLHAIHSRQQTAIDECIQQAANADAALMALLQEGDETKVAARARSWADDLLTLHDSLAEVLRGGDDTPQLADLPEYQPEATVSRPVYVVNGNGFNGSAPPPSEPFTRLVEEALRRLNSPANLATCGLISQIPATLRAEGDRPVNGEATPLEQARSLREVLVTSIERLKPASGTSGSQAIQYRILREEYIEGRPNNYIMTHLSISESTFHRNRREGIAALAHELARQEELLVQRATPNGLPSKPA
jgi:hypothetical protein